MHHQHHHFLQDVVPFLALLLFSPAALSAESDLKTGSLEGVNGAACIGMMDGTLPSYVPPDFHYSGTIRRYFLAAEIQPWDYAPSGILSSLFVINRPTIIIKRPRWTSVFFFHFYHYQKKNFCSWAFLYNKAGARGPSTDFNI